MPGGGGRWAAVRCALIPYLAAAGIAAASTGAALSKRFADQEVFADSAEGLA